MESRRLLPARLGFRTSSAASVSVCGVVALSFCRGGSKPQQGKGDGEGGGKDEGGDLKSAGVAGGGGWGQGCAGGWVSCVCWGVWGWDGEADRPADLDRCQR